MTNSLRFLRDPDYKFGLGLAALGRPGYINLGHGEDIDDRSVEGMRENAHQVLDAAWKAGIRYFDAARSYGRAEEFLGSWLTERGIDPESVDIGSKWGYTYTANWQVQAEHHEIKEHSLDVLNRQWGETHHNLRGQLDLYQIHSATLESGVLENMAVLARLAELKSEGIAIGLTVSGANQAEVIERAIPIEVDGSRLFDSVQATWNLLEQSAGGTLKAAHESGMAVIVKEALANGRLTPGNANNPDFVRQYHLLQEEAMRLNTTVDALALAAARRQSWADMVLSGAANTNHLASNIRARHVMFDDEAAVALSSLVEPPESYWQTRSDLEWN
ncbi:MAG: aldo/keto reductase [Chloroflexi bacterium]|nr:aldo/keto reductase [Chloroflexota bacterium]